MSQQYVLQIKSTGNIDEAIRMASTFQTMILNAGHIVQETTVKTKEETDAELAAAVKAAIPAQ